MYYAIFDTGPGFLQWMGEAENPVAAIKALHKDVEDFNFDDQDPSDECLVLYPLQEEEVAKLDDLLSKGEHIYQDFASEGMECSVAQVRQILGL